MQWNNVAFSFLWLFTGLCQLAVMFWAEKRRISLGVGDGGFSAWCLFGSYSSVKLKNLILEDEFLIASSLSFDAGNLTT